MSDTRIEALEAEIDRLRDKIAELETRKGWPFEAAHHDEHHDREDAFRSRIADMESVLRIALAALVKTPNRGKEEDAAIIWIDAILATKGP